ncbi:toxin-antitoxin system, antitoxin component, Xre family [Klebsiella variicola]|nr:toxin-antitoxin system, antitoxin component, Xre family [Klebsiella variicola]
MMGRTLEQLLIDEKPDVVAEAQAIAKDILLNIHLAELREKVQKTQVEMAQNLGIKQPTVAGMEKPGRDLKLSTLKRYVEAAGGKLRLDVELPDGSHYEFVL